MNTLNEERRNYNESCITAKKSRRTKKNEIYFGNELSVLAFFNTDLGQIFECNVRNEVGLIKRRKAPRKPEVVFDCVHIHSLTIYTGLIEYRLLGDMKAPLLICFPFFKAQRWRQHIYWTLSEL